MADAVVAESSSSSSSSSSSAPPPPQQQQQQQPQYSQSLHYYQQPPAAAAAAGAGAASRPVSDWSMWLHASICSCPDPPPAPPSSFPSTLYATTCTTAYTLPPVATLASAASTNPSSTLFSVLSFSSLSPYSHGLFRGFLIGASFIIVMEACALFFVCFLLFDPTRKLVAHLSPVAAGPSSSSSPQQPKKISATRAVRKQASVLPFRRPKTVADFYDHSINEHELPWPSNIVDFLKTALIPTPEDSPYDALKIDASPSSSATPEAATAKAAKPPAVMGVQILAASPPDEAKWLNVLVHRFFLALRDSPLFKMRMMAKMAERTNVKLRTNSFVSHITILDVSLGEHVPEVLGVRMVKSRSEDLAVVLELDVAYKGGCTVAIETTLTAGAKFPVQVHTSGFAGKMLLRAPSVDWSDMVSVAFVEDPGISFLVDSPLTVRENELFRRAVNKVLASVLRRAVLEMWVLPNWRNIFMPMMTPTPEVNQPERK
ncbi:hypothetical protein DFJ73DRAFT_767241 [Zopfochytrium polystomum]|nr:hypothetical protein DFJ73DRAFT_767241 [Zopfochytrium polystomum]